MHIYRVIETESYEGVHFERFFLTRADAVKCMNQHIQNRAKDRLVYDLLAHDLAEAEGGYYRILIEEVDVH